MQLSLVSCRFRCEFNRKKTGIGDHSFVVRNWNAMVKHYPDSRFLKLFGLHLVNTIIVDLVYKFQDKILRIPCLSDKKIDKIMIEI